ncbi:MAG: MoaD/ThiS family protein [Leptospirales bacterium]|nr:MoaD/ThiS family protein [Leptospirales bacterium]
MIVTILPFASAKTVLKYDKKQISLKDGTSVSGLMKELVSENPPLSGMKFLFAVNTEYVDTSHILEDGDKLAIFPPVSGG